MKIFSFPQLATGTQSHVTRSSLTSRKAAAHSEAEKIYFVAPMGSHHHSNIPPIRYCYARMYGGHESKTLSARGQREAGTKCPFHSIGHRRTYYYYMKTNWPLNIYELNAIIASFVCAINPFAVICQYNKYIFSVLFFFGIFFLFISIWSKVARPRGLQSRMTSEGIGRYVTGYVSHGWESPSTTTIDDDNGKWHTRPSVMLKYSSICKPIFMATVVDADSFFFSSFNTIHVVDPAGRI